MRDEPPASADEAEGDRKALVLHRGQTPPDGDWRVWLFMGGRGAGKTRAGAEWLRRLIAGGAARRVALVGPTLGDVREVMIEGASGLRSISSDSDRPDYVVSRRRLIWPNGAEGHVFSAEDADSLRGPQFDAAWCDEIGAWRKGMQAWNMLMFALRLGHRPRVAATTTPRPVELVQRLVRDARAGRGRIAITHGTMHDNRANLACDFVETMEDAYAGTELGRQELEGELIEDPAGALWTRSMIERGRVRPEDTGDVFDRVVVAVDPPASVGPGAAACGIVAAGVRAGTVYVLADATVRGLRPLDWAGRAAALARRWNAADIVAESNQGGEMVRDVMEMAGAGPHDGVRLLLRRADLSKQMRATPVSVMYEKGLVRHVGVLRELEEQMYVFGAAGTGSPDRVDALVWAVKELTDRKATPGVRQV